MVLLTYLKQILLACGYCGASTAALTRSLTSLAAAPAMNDPGGI